MSESIYVNYSGVESVEEALQQADTQIQNVLNNLQDVINPLRASWAGVSEDAYTAVQARWNNDMAQMSATLSQYNQTLGQMKINYANTDANLGAQWEQIT